ncbi:MAG: glycosyltransferase family 2 protein [Leptospira sp.]|nr:glycosyltransferase family 2 protein [Leptospira sp.]
MLSVILPTYNERENISEYLSSIHSLLNRKNIDYEIIVVDDNSPDKTWELVQKLKKSLDNIQLYRRMGERGLSSAILFGIIQSQGEYVCVMDADGQHDESIIPDLLDKIHSEDLDLVVGSRAFPDHDYGEMPTHRKFISKFASKIANWIYPLPIGDPLSGFFILRKNKILNGIQKLNPRGFKLLLEILCRFPDLKTSEFPYRFKKRLHGKTKLSSLVVLEYILSLIEIRYMIRFSPIFIKYSIVGIMGIFVNLLFQIIFDSILPNKELDFPGNPFLKPSLSVILGFEISLIHNFLWNHHWTFMGREEKLWKALIKFHLVSVFSFIIQISTWYYIYSIWIASVEEHSQYATNIANLAGILFAFISNYILNKNITWKKED